MIKIKASTYIATITIIISCSAAWALATSKSNDGNEVSIASNVSDNPNSKQANSKPLTEQEILTHLLMAEMAEQRNMLDVALDNYFLVAKQTKDPQVAQLATQLAVELEKPNKALEAANIWATSAPEDIQAQLVALSLYVNVDVDKTGLFLERAFAIKQPDLDQHLLMIFEKLPPNAQNNLTAAMYKVADKSPQDPTIQLAAAQISAVQLDIESATKRVNAALKLQPDLTGAIELNAKLIRYGAKDDNSALNYLSKQVTKFPKNSSLKMFYVSALIDNNEFGKATPILESLSKDAQFGGDALITLGEIYISKNNYPLATATIKRALPFPGSVDKARFYLGQLSELNNKNADAIQWYEQIDESSEFQTSAFLRAAYLYSLSGEYSQALSTLQNANPETFDDQKQVLLTEIDILIDANQLDQALDNSNRLIGILPDDIDFLYARSVVLGLLNKNAESERDLRLIISIDPNNANALNALGFTLANQPNRVNEAMPFLEKALALNPDNPAFMDSMGWLLYKLGRNQEAIAMLEKAYKLSGDPEIAAHLGEVLWANGNREAAKSIWKKGLASANDNKLIQQTMDRLKVPVAELTTPPKPRLKATN